METLLEKAKAVRSVSKNKKVTTEDIALAMAWLRNEVNATQVSVAYGRPPGSSMMYRIANILKSAYQEGLIEIKRR